MANSSSGLPFMTDTFPRAIIFGPARLLGIISFQPFLELFSRHVDRVVEISVLLSGVASIAYAASSLNDILIAFNHRDGSSCGLPCGEHETCGFGLDRMMSKRSCFEMTEVHSTED